MLQKLHRTETMQIHTWPGAGLPGQPSILAVRSARLLWPRKPSCLVQCSDTSLLQSAKSGRAWGIEVNLNLLDPFLVCVLEIQVLNRTAQNSC